MPCNKCSNGKWQIGAKGPCAFLTKEQCERALAAIYATVNKIKDLYATLKGNC